MELRYLLKFSCPKLAATKHHSQFEHFPQGQLYFLSYYSHPSPTKAVKHRLKTCLQSQTSWVQIPALPLTGWITLVTLLKFSVPRFTLHEVPTSWHHYDNDTGVLNTCKRLSYTWSTLKNTHSLPLSPSLTEGDYLPRSRSQEGITGAGKEGWGKGSQRLNCFPSNGSA